jgi:hypothetical protein
MMSRTLTTTQRSIVRQLSTPNLLAIFYRHRWKLKEAWISRWRRYSHTEEFLIRYVALRALQPLQGCHTWTSSNRELMNDTTLQTLVPRNLVEVIFPLGEEN